MHERKLAFFPVVQEHCVQTDLAKNVWTRAYLIGVKLIVILRHIIAYFSINIRWHSQNVSSDSRKWLIKHLFPPSSCKTQINKQNSYLLLASLQSGSVPELDMHESKHFLPGQFVHSEAFHKISCWDCLYLNVLSFRHSIKFPAGITMCLYLTI
jgi:hypothetical protein